MSRSSLTPLLVLLAFAACGGASPSSSDNAASITSAGAGKDVSSIAIDPSDGTLMAGSGPAFYRLPPGAKAPEKAAGNLSTPSGKGTLTRDVVVRFAADGTIIASGHSGEAALPPVLGLVKSTDEGETWQSISGLGKADYHEIELAGHRIFALRNEDPGMIEISSDGGKTWESREAPSVATPIDIAINPGNPDQWAVSTNQGTFISANGGKSWRQWDTTFGPRIAWAKPDALYLAGKDGKVKKSPDAGKTWQDVGTIGSGPRELTVSPKGELYASIAGGEIRRSTDGGATWSEVATFG
jgi:BNR/Asp-box repeat protein